MKYKVIEDNGGGLHLYVFSGRRCVWAHTGYEYNSDVAGAWFPYSKYIGGWARNGEPVLRPPRLRERHVRAASGAGTALVGPVLGGLLG